MGTRKVNSCDSTVAHKKNKVWAYLYMPFLYILVLSLLFAVVIVPYKSSFLSWINLISSPVGFDYSTLHSIYNGYVEPDDTSAIDQPEISEPENAEETVSMKYVQVPFYNTEYAHLTCEELGIDCAVYFGDSNAAMRKGAGQYAGSYLPGYNGQILMCAHNTTYFKPLEFVEIGQVFTLTTNYGIYKYEVYEFKVLDHKDKSAYDLTVQDGEELVLYTCYPFYRMSSVKTDRLFVYCKKISGPRVVED